MKDFRHITDYILSYSYKAVIPGVNVNCVGNQKTFDRPYFEEVLVRLDDPIFSGRIGLPIFTRPEHHDPEQEADLTFSMENQEATFIHLCCDPDAKPDLRTGKPGWGWASQRWQNEVGSIMVVRQDKEAFSPFLVEALCIYCRYEIRPLLAHSMGEYAPDKPISKDFVLSMICRPTFSIFWYNLLGGKRKGRRVPRCRVSL